MNRYWVSIHRPNDYDPSLENEAMGREINALNDEMVAAGVRVFVGGLHSPGEAMALRREADGQVSATRGPYLRTTEHVGGFWVLEVADLDAALEWGRKAAAACRASVEVRPFHSHRPVQS